MIYAELKKLLNAETLVDGNESDLVVDSAISSDLVSEILMYSEENSVLLTALVNPQIIRVADMIDISGIIFVQGKKPEDEIIDLAEDKCVPTAVTDCTLFEASGKLYGEGIKPCNYSGN